jgi:hypothetical protein
LAQAPSPAQMGMAPGAPPTSAPATLSVLDYGTPRTWAAIGTVDPVAHTFTPLSGGGGASCTTSGAPCFVTAGVGTFLDGFSPTLGTTSDPACSAPNAGCSEIAMLRAIWNAVQSGVANSGSAFPNPAVGFGGDGSGNIAPVYEADGQSAINVSAAGTSLVIAAVATKRLFITGFDVTGTGTGTTAKFEYGTQASTACDTGATPLTGPYPPGVPIARGGGLGPIWTLPASSQLCIVVTGTSPQYSGSVSFTSGP